MSSQKPPLPPVDEDVLDAVTPRPPAGAQAPDYTERLMRDVPAPLREPLDPAVLWPEQLGGKPDVNALKEHFRQEGRLHEEDAHKIIKMAADLLKQESNLLDIDAPITVAGDVHGQFYDLLELFEVGGPPPDTKYLFLGDYVDRGCFSTEVTLTLLAYKANFPNDFFMLRGNHECRHITSYFNFKQECLYKYSEDLYDQFMQCFDCLALAATVRTSYGQFLCLHGGLSPDVDKVEEINELYRFQEPPEEGPMCDILWADPLAEPEELAENEEELDEFLAIEFVPNSVRGCSYYFGHAAVCSFLENNDILSIIRAHEAQPEGYRLHRSRFDMEFPSVVTLFSAPNYCDTHDNKAAILVIDDELFEFSKFDHSPHPFFLPNFMNAFTWSLPFVAEKVSEMVFGIMRLVEEGAEEDEEDDEERREAIRQRVRQIGKALQMYKALRETNQNTVTDEYMRELAKQHQVSHDLLIEGEDALRDKLLELCARFDVAREEDILNERRPGSPDGTTSKGKEEEMVMDRAEFKNKTDRWTSSAHTTRGLQRRKSMPKILIKNEDDTIHTIRMGLNTRAMRVVEDTRRRLGSSGSDISLHVPAWLRAGGKGKSRKTKVNRRGMSMSNLLNELAITEEDYSSEEEEGKLGLNNARRVSRDLSDSDGEMSPVEELDELDKAWEQRKHAGSRAAAAVAAEEEGKQ